MRRQVPRLRNNQEGAKVDDPTRSEVQEIGQHAAATKVDQFGSCVAATKAASEGGETLSDPEQTYTRRDSEA